MHKIGITTIIIVLLHAVLMIDSAYAGQPVVLTQGQASYSLGKRLEYLVDPTGRLTIDDVLSSTYSAKFQSSTVDVPHFGFTKSSLWFRVDLRADRTLHPSQLWLLESQYPLLNWIDVYLLNDKGEIQAQHGGNRRSFHNRSIITRHPNFNLEIPPGEKRTLFVNIRTEGSAVVPLVLWDAQAFMKTQQDVQLVMGLYFGGIIAMLAINLLALVVTRDASFVYYIFHLSSIGLFFFAMNGYLFQYIFPDRPEIAWHASLYLAGITCFAMLQFCRSFLDLRTHMPRANTFINYLCLAPASIAIIGMFGSYHEAYRFCLGFGVFTTVTIFFLTLWAWRNCWKQARYFLLGWIVLSIGVMTIVLCSMGVIPSNFLTTYGVQISSFIEFMVMAYALADRLRILNEKNQQIQRDTMATLEMRVAERTSELTMAHAQAERATHYKSVFIAQLSHEIRTPMNAIIGLTHLALNTDLTSRQRSYIANVKRAASVLHGILNDILDFSKIEAGKLELEQIEFELAQVLENVAAATAFRAEEKGLELIFYSQPTLPSRLVGDPTRLGQIILNLVNNAIKFTDRGEVVVRLEGRYVQEQRVELAISVRDTGIGLTQEQIGRLFRSFQQADQSTTRRYGGTGLGLAISKELVEAMGGRISVQSLPACGSTFAFTVSLELPSSENTPLISHPNLSGRRVMIVDDNPTMRNILSEQLLNSSAEVYCAASTDEALKLLATAAARGNPACDLVLLDTCLPGENALDAARALSERFSPAICLLSGQLGQSMTPTAQAVGIRHFLTKPITPQGLQKLLAEVFFCGPTDWNSVVIAANSQSVPNLTGTTILVAEDNEINQQVVCEILEAAGASCDIAVNGREAVRLALDPARRYDLLLMDLQMPELDGFEATREIRRHLAADELSLVALTAHSLESERLLCLELGMNDYLTKPIDPVKLLTTVAHWTDAGGSIKPGVPDVFPAVLPGFEDLQGALLRMNGNAALLRRLLAAFHARFADFSTEFQTALESGDHLGVLCIVHNLRGVSSTLGAMSIAAMATECEQVLRRNNGKNLRPDLALSLMASLEPALKTSFKFRQEIQEEILRTHANPGPAIEEAEFESMLQNLNTLTQNRNLKAREVFARLRTTIAEHVGSELAEELHFAFDKFNYDVALRLLEHLEILLRRGSALSKMP